MRFIVDECTGPAVAAWLEAEGHDVYSVSDRSPGDLDEEVLRRAVTEDRILITNDRDFGELIFREGRAHHGVVFLRLHDERAASKIRVLDGLLASYADQLANQFVMVTETQVRVSAR